MIFKPLLLFVLSTLVTSSVTAFGGEVLLTDDFLEAKDPIRRASRGDWKFEEGAASCTQDDELYKKYKLTKEEIAFIERMIRPVTKSDE